MYKDENGVTITLNIPSQDEGLCFTACVSEVISDDCGFLAQGIGCLDPQCDCSPPPPTTSTTTTTTTTLEPTTTTTTTQSPTTTTTPSPTTTTTTTVSPYCYVIESVQSAPGECFDCPGYFSSTTDTFIKFYDGCGGTQIPAPFDINVTAYYSDASTQNTFISSGTAGSVLIASSDVQCVAPPTCGEIANGIRQPIFLGAPVVFSQVMPRITAGTQICALYGAFNLAAKAIQVGGGMQIATDASVGFQSDTTAFRGVNRFGVTVHDVGNASGTPASRVPGAVVCLATS